MKCPSCKKTDKVRKFLSVQICDRCNLGFTGFDKGEEVCEAFGRHDYTGNPNSCASGGTCVRCGHFEQCG